VAEAHDQPGELTLVLVEVTVDQVVHLTPMPVAAVQVGILEVVVLEALPATSATVPLVPEEEEVEGGHSSAHITVKL